MSTKKTVLIPSYRQEITKEPDAVQGKWTAAFPDALSFKLQGGGKVPSDYKWRSSPKQWQEEFTTETYERRQRLLREEQATTKQAQLPASTQK